jgi:RNA polymerase sigma-70 factor, ECF subfamily
MEPHQTDEFLMANVAQGQRAPLETLVRRHGSGLLTFLRRTVNDLHRAEELFQEVFLAIWTKRQQYEFPRSFRNWLYAIALNRCRQDFRSRPALMLPLDEGEFGAAPAAATPSPIEAAIATETAARVAQAVARLPAQQRVVVVLRVWEGMSYLEIADQLELSEVTARSHMHHALATLRKYLGPSV